MSSRARVLILLLPLVLALPATGLASGNDGPHAGAITATDLTSSGVRLSGNVLPAKDEDTLWWIAYETPADSYTRTAPIEIESDRQQRPVMVSATLSGLPAASGIRAQLVAWADDEPTAYGPILSFTTTNADGSPAPTPAPTEPGPTSPTPGAPSTPPAAAPITPPSPSLGETVVAAAASGTVRVRLPGSGAFVTLADAATVPVGTVVDARAGAISLSTAVAGGGVQKATFGGARFQVRQAPDSGGRTDLHLRGGSFAGCAHATRHRSVSAVIATKGKRTRVRRLWGKDDGGRFRTHGRDSVATVRGTAWSMADRCDGTVTRVTEGAVDVRNRHTGRVVRVRAGERHVAKHRR